MINQGNPPGRGKTLLALLCMLIASVLVTGAAAYAALEWMPCRWFGSSFEGACGYGAVMATAMVALVLCPVLFVSLSLYYFRRGKGVVGAPASLVEGPFPAPALLKRWRATFAATMVANLLPFLLMFAAHDFSSLLQSALWWLGMLLLLANAVMAYQVANHLQRQPVVMAVVSVVVGWIGAAGVFIYLYQTIKRTRLAGHVHADIAPATHDLS
jgi:hypothetical protein